jgi:protein TilB
MDSSLISLDIQPNYVRVTLKGKSLQLALNDEVKPDSSTALRSQTTGYLVIKMPKLNAEPVKSKPNEASLTTPANKTRSQNEKPAKSSNYLEVDSKLSANKIDLSQIVQNNLDQAKSNSKIMLNCAGKRVAKERENSPSFVDSDDVPPLI